MALPSCGQEDCIAMVGSHHLGGIWLLATTIAAQLRLHASWVACNRSCGNCNYNHLIVAAIVVAKWRRMSGGGGGRRTTEEVVAERGWRDEAVGGAGRRMVARGVERSAGRKRWWQEEDGEKRLQERRMEEVLVVAGVEMIGGGRWRRWDSGKGDEGCIAFYASRMHNVLNVGDMSDMSPDMSDMSPDMSASR